MAHVCILRQIALNFSQGDQDLNIYAYSVLPFYLLSPLRLNMLRVIHATYLKKKKKLVNMSFIIIKN